MAPGFDFSSRSFVAVSTKLCSWEVSPQKDKALTRSTNDSLGGYPQIWVVAGSVDCGAPLVADTCSITGTSDRQTSFPLPTFSLVSTHFTVFIGSRVGQNTFTPTVIPTALALQATTKLARRTMLLSQPTRAKLDAVERNGWTSEGMDGVHVRKNSNYYKWGEARFISTTDANSPDSELHFSNTTCHSRHIAPRSYDYNVCSGNEPSDDFKSNSLAEVRHFVANITPLFVSLSPNTAAYMPSWISYVTSAIISFVQLGVALRAMNSRGGEKLGWKLKARNIGATLVAIFRTIWVTIKIVDHRNSLKTLPFLSPVLWLDWGTCYRSPLDSGSHSGMARFRVDRGALGSLFMANSHRICRP